MDVSNASTAQEELRHWQEEYPVAELAYRPSGRTTASAVAVMVFGVPFAGLASLAVGIAAGLLAALVTGLFGGVIMWFSRRVPGLRSIAESHISPSVIFIGGAVSVVVGAVACGWAMGTLIAALGRVGRNRSAYTVGAIAAISTFLFLFFGLWEGNMRYNPDFPELLRGWLGSLVGVIYAGIGAAIAAKTGSSSVLEFYFCEDCDLFMTPHKWCITRGSIPVVRMALSCSGDFDREKVQIEKHGPGRIRLTRCTQCSRGYIDLHIHFSASWKEGEAKPSITSEWLTGSRHLDALEAERWAQVLAQAKEGSVAREAEKESRTNQELHELAGSTKDELKAEYVDACEDRRRLISRHFRDKGWGSPVDRIPCTKCGAMVLPETARATGGLCMPCHKNGEQISENRSLKGPCSTLD
ncbi:MAG: hypothetical protein KJ072_00225 [Verrucomicrobia bacterium]|nr:hypothetical protein [Verrucomicrobiota bacterium]